VVIERATRSGPLDWPPGYLPSKSRRYGEATFWYGWHGSEAGSGHSRRVAVEGLIRRATAHEE
jgi:hypothetical protein